MPLFKNSFSKDIQDELNYRKSFNALQTVLMPHVRVTSLVETEGVWSLSDPNKKYQQLRGFTLGIADLDNMNSLSSYFNRGGQTGTGIGITYMGNKPTPVHIDTVPNLPPPGVTGVTISTQSKGGFIFKAVVSLKFYGKEQYDFIYQTMLRPGNPIVIEYGHTRNPVTDEQLLGGKGFFESAPDEPPRVGLEYESVSAAGTTNKDLEFFDVLDGSTFQKYVDNFRNNIPLKPTRNSGAVIGLVSNFRTRLNAQNEYEAEIEIINALEFLFTLGIDDTFLDYRAGSKQSSSIRQNFGQTEEGWQPDHDIYFQSVIEDGLYDVREEQIAAQNFVTNVTSTVAYHNQIILPSEWTVDPWDIPWTNGEPTLNRTTSTKDIETQQKYINRSGSDITYVSLQYFLDRLLPRIITSAFSNSEVFKYEIKLESADKDDPDRIIYYPELRSTDIQKILINNDNLYSEMDVLNSRNKLHQGYSTFFRDLRQNSYSYKYILDPTLSDLDTSTSTQADRDARQTANTFFAIIPEWRLKELYTNTNTLGGIFINYLVIRDAFNSSNSVAEAMQKVLNQINVSSNNILKLKMRYIDTESEEVPFFTSDAARFRISAMVEGDIEMKSAKKIVLTIFDERKMVADNIGNKKSNLFTFFSGNVSEALSYDLNFSLPNAIASSVMASTFNPLETIGGTSGDPQLKTVVDYGYALDANGEVIVKSMLRDQQLTGDENISGRGETVQELVRSGVVIPEVHGAREQVTKRYNQLNNSTDRAEILAIMESGAMASLTYLANQRTRHGYVRAAGGTHNFAENGTQGLSSNQIERIISKALLNQAMDEVATGAPGVDSRTSEDDMAEERLLKQIIGYQELTPAVMKASTIRSNLIQQTSLPAAPQINIKLQGLDGFKFGNLFTVKNVLPSPYNETNVFMVTGYKHTIDSTAWTTELQGQLIASGQPHFKKAMETWNRRTLTSEEEGRYGGFNR